MIPLWARLMEASYDDGDPDREELMRNDQSVAMWRLDRLSRNIVAAAMLCRAFKQGIDYVDDGDGGSWWHVPWSPGCGRQAP